MQLTNLILPLAVFALFGCADPNSGDAQKQSPTTLKIPPAPISKPSPVPDFNAIKHIPAKKEAFFSYLQTRIEKSNNHVWSEREFVQGYISEQRQENITPDQLVELTNLTHRYKLEVPETLDDEFFAMLLARIDVVPASLVLAQGANESAWGTSRFARDGLNFFGIWCYSKGCGLVPKSRNSGAKHEVRKFNSVQQGVAYYIHNINTGGAYSDFRNIRAELRLDNERLSGVKLANGLIKYSERGQAYVSEISNIITHNELSTYDIDRAEYLTNR